MSLAFGVLLAVAAAGGAMPHPPATPTETVVDIIHGRPVADPYRWLEQLDDPMVEAWARAQNDYTRQVLGAVASSSPENVVFPQTREIAIEASRYRRLPSGKAVFLARMAEDPVDAIYIKSTDGTVTRAFAPAPTSDGNVRTIAFFVPAPDERHVALAMGESGSENNALYVVNLKTGRLIDGPIPGVRFEGVSWWPDSRRFVYPRLREADPGRAGAALYAGQQVFAHTVGTGWRYDPLVFGRAMPSSADIPEGDFPVVDIQADAGVWPAFRRRRPGVRVVRRSS